MNVLSTTRNRHPVDELGDVRESLKSLEAREKELKEEVGRLMGTKDSLGGDNFIARQSISERKGALDEKVIAAKLGVENLDAFRKPPVAVVTIRVTPRITDESEAA